MSIVADHQEMRDVAAAVTVAAEDSAEEIASCRAQLHTLTDVFRGTTAVAFQERYQEWDHAATELLDSLRGLGAWLHGAAEAFAEHDRSGADALRA